MLKGAVVSFFSTHAQQYSGKPGEYWGRISYQELAIPWHRFSPGVVKVLVNFYRSGEDSAFDSQRSRATFDLSKQSSVEAVKKHLTEILGLKELALKFSMADFELKLFRLQRSSNGKTENYSIFTQQQWQMEIPFLLGDEGQSELNGKCQIFGQTHFIGNSCHVCADDEQRSMMQLELEYNGVATNKLPRCQVLNLCTFFKMLWTMFHL